MVVGTLLRFDRSLGSRRCVLINVADVPVDRLGTSLVEARGGISARPLRF